MMFEQEYVDGFAEKCAELGLDPANFGFEKKSELQLLTEALPRMDSTDLAIIEGFAKECAANNHDPEPLLKMAILGGVRNPISAYGAAGLLRRDAAQGPEPHKPKGFASGIKGVWNKHVGSRGSGVGRWAAGVGSGLKGAFKGLNEGGVGNMRSGYQQGAAPAQQQYDAANAQQRQRGEAQLGVAGAQWNRNVAAPVRAAGQKAISPISVGAAYLGGGAQAGANVYDAPQRTMDQANQRLTQAQTTLAGLPGAPQPAQQAQQPQNYMAMRQARQAQQQGNPANQTENRLQGMASQLPGQTTTSPLPGGGTRTTTQRSGTFVAGQPYDPQNPTAQQRAVQQIRGQAAGQQQPNAEANRRYNAGVRHHNELTMQSPMFQPTFDQWNATQPGGSYPKGEDGRILPY